MTPQSLLPPAALRAALDRLPSWINSSGRHIDRSACCVLTAASVRMHAGRRIRMTSTRSKQSCIVPGGRAQREAIGTITITAAQMHEIATMGDTRDRVQGDTRSTRANAMRPHHIETRDAPEVQKQKTPKERKRGRSRTAVHSTGPTHASDNPNRITSSEGKRLGLWGDFPLDNLPAGWTQTFTIERHCHNSRLAVHYLICPTCGLKKRKLFLPRCTTREHELSELAEGWVKMLDARSHRGPGSLTPELIDLRARIINHFGILFRSRQFQCGKCLGLRYGSRYRGRGT
ncbi:MAG: hypothetical protein ACR2GY_11035 [Phycisphaerales bacterium]